MTYTVEEVRDLLKAATRIAELEEVVKASKAELKIWYAKYVEVCPHTDVIRYDPNIRSWGKKIICMSCGLVDNAIIGGTSGDEYNYGSAGHNDVNYWNNSIIHDVSNQQADKYRKNHGWSLVNGKPAKDQYS